MKKQIALLILLFCCLHASAQLSDTTNWKTQVDPQFFSTLAYPPDWEINNLDSGSYTITSPKENDSDLYRENVSFLAVKVPDAIMEKGVKNFAEASFIKIENSLQSVRILAHRNITTNGLSMYLIVYNGVASGQYLYWKQMFYLYNNVAYIITYTGAAGKKDHYAVAGGDILNSFMPLIVKNG